MWILCQKSQKRFNVPSLSHKDKHSSLLFSCQSLSYDSITNLAQYDIIVTANLQQLPKLTSQLYILNGRTSSDGCALTSIPNGTCNKNGLILQPIRLRQTKPAETASLETKQKARMTSTRIQRSFQSDSSSEVSNSIPYLFENGPL